MASRVALTALLLAVLAFIVIAIRLSRQLDETRATMHAGMADVSRALDQRKKLVDDWAKKESEVIDQQKRILEHLEKIEKEQSP